MTVAPALLAHLHGLALTVTRWPDGVEAKSFFQKQSPAHRPEWVRTATLPAGSKKIDYTLATDEHTVIEHPRLGHPLRFHEWLRFITFKTGHHHNEGLMILPARARELLPPLEDGMLPVERALELQLRLMDVG